MEEKYTMNVNAPHYQPSGKEVKLKDCLNVQKVRELVAKIDASSVTDEEKQFLRLATTRHYVFNYSKIADYYAQASKEMQELMEDSALVIIDFDDAIGKGYAKLNKAIEDILTDKVGDINA